MTTALEYCKMYYALLPHHTDLCLKRSRVTLQTKLNYSNFQMSYLAIQL